MHYKIRFHYPIFRMISRAATVALAVTVPFTMTVVFNEATQAETILHSFTGGGDGETPYAGLTEVGVPLMRESHRDLLPGRQMAARCGPLLACNSASDCVNFQPRLLCGLHRRT